MLGLVLCLNFFTAESQNLVGNPSFEEYSSCPTLSTNGIPKAIGWNGFSADYFHSCSQFSPLPLNNGNGYQCAATGNAIVGIYTRVPLVLTYREFVGAQLDSALILGQKYYVTVKVNLADNYNCATNRLGVLFTNDSDLAPALCKIKERNNNLKIGVVVPIRGGNRKASVSLQKYLQSRYWGTSVYFYPGCLSIFIFISIKKWLFR